MKLQYPLVLASTSPQRKYLLEQMKVPFILFTKPIDEDFPNTLEQEKVAEYLAIKKNNAYQTEFQDHLILTADSIVLCKNKILNKPENLEEGIRMLTFLSGTIHSVITSVCLSLNGVFTVVSSQTRVHLCKFSPSEIEYYVKHFHPFDKAGGYAIQEWIGLIGVKKISGSYTNIVGLPTDIVYKLLQKYRI
ncbi:MAG: Maf family nucleotide pyrophosphatase [Chitinophagaceae bacterium]|nr:Maf family nucleotide pyrophosphatase [Chitinophagaceae bacterium]